MFISRKRPSDVPIARDNATQVRYSRKPMSCILDFSSERKWLKTGDLHEDHFNQFCQVFMHATTFHPTVFDFVNKKSCISAS